MGILKFLSVVVAILLGLLVAAVVVLRLIEPILLRLGVKLP